MSGDTGPSLEEQLAAQAEAKRKADIEAQIKADQNAATQAALDATKEPADDTGDTLLSKKKKASQLATSLNQSGTLLQ